MLKISLGIALFVVFAVALYILRARDGRGKFGMASAQTVALALVCVLMLAGGLVFTAALD